MDTKYTLLQLLPMIDPPVAAPPVASPPAAVMTKERRTKQCVACGATNHMRKSSARCPYYRKKPTNPLDALAVVAATVGVASLPGNATDSFDVLVDVATADAAATAGVAATADSTVNLSTTNFIQVPSECGSKTLKYTPVVEVGSKSFKERDTIFKVYKKEVSGSRTRLVETPPTASVLVDRFWPLPLVEKMMLSSHQYCLQKRLQYPGLYIWSKKN